MEVLILAVTVYVATYMLYVSFSGQIWNYVSPQIVTLSLTLLIASVLATSSMIFTHTLIHFSRKKSIRYLVLLLMAFDAIVVCIMFLISHPSFELWSPFADRNRNRSLAIAWGMMLMIGSLAGSFSGESPASLRARLIGFLTGFIIYPAICVWMLLSPEPVFISTEPSGGLSGLTPTGWAMILVLGFFMSVSFFKYLREWIRNRDREIIALTSSMFFWLFALVVVVILENPFQFAEIIWVGSVTAGFSLIAIAMLSTVIIEPRRELERTVEKQTEELSISRKESEFYLGMWTHKMGNLLQGLLVYLDLLSTSEVDEEKVTNHRRSAMEIAREATLLNTQVTMLSQASDSEHIKRKSISLAGIISGAMDKSSKLLNPASFRVNFRTLSDVQVMGDRMLDIAILSILSFFVKARLHEDLNITIWYERKGDLVHTYIECVGRKIPDAIQEFLQEQKVPPTPSIELDIYVARTIVELFDGSISYKHDNEERINRITLTLNAGT
ncbi:MAG: hypothetical protein ACFFF4_11485 [Candidatus Thorarchaeota archaeon]